MYVLDKLLSRRGEERSEWKRNFNINFPKQRLVANGLVPGAIVDEEAPPKLLLEKLVEVVRLCGDTSDDATLTQVVKVCRELKIQRVGELIFCSSFNLFLLRIFVGYMA
jgi:hypothetical protein